MTNGIPEYSVCLFFQDGNYEYVQRFVFAHEAAEAAVHYATSIGAKLGYVQRVIITDGGDEINFEWKYGEGIIFPPRASER